MHWTGNGVSWVSQFIRTANGKGSLGLWVFFLALGLRLLYLFQSKDNPLMYYPVLDEAYYIDLARRIAGGYWLGEERPFFMDPLYGYFLGVVFSIFGEDLLVVRLLQVSLDSLNVVLILRLGTKVGSRSAAYAGAFIYAAYGVAFFHASLILKTTLTVTMPLLYLLFLLRTVERPGMIRWWLLGAYAAIMGYLWAGLLLIAPFTLLAYWLLSRPRRSEVTRCGLFFVGGMAVLLALGMLRNYSVGGGPIFMNTQGGRLLYASNNPDNLTGRYSVPFFSRAHPEESEADFHREAERRLGKDLSAQEVSAYWTRETVRFLRENPTAVAHLLWNKIKGTIGDYEIPTNHSYSLSSRFAAVARWPLPGFALILSLGLPGLVVASFRMKGVLWLWVPILSVLITILIFYTSSRFRMPIVPFLALGSGLGLGMLSEWFKKRKHGSITAFLVTAGILYGASVGIPKPAYSGTEEFYLAKAYWAQNRLDEAGKVALEGAEQFPGQAGFPVLLGMVALSRGHMDEAVQHNLEGIRRDPGYADAYHNLGLSHLIAGRPADALGSVEKAISLSPQPRYFFTLARIHEALGHEAEAKRFYREYLRLSKPSDPFRKEVLGKVGAPQ